MSELFQGCSFLDIQSLTIHWRTKFGAANVLNLNLRSFGPNCHPRIVERFEIAAIAFSKIPRLQSIRPFERINHI